MVQFGVMEFVENVEKDLTMKIKRFVRSAVLICPECYSEVDGNVCKNCGLVFESRPIISDLESNMDKKRDSDEDEEFSRGVQKWHSPNILYATIHSGKTKNLELKRAFKHEYKVTHQAKFGSKYLNGYQEIKRICSSLHLNENIVSTAVYFLRVLIDKGYMSRSRRKYATFAALVILGTRLNFIPFRYEQIYEYTDESPKSIKGAYNTILKELNLKTPKFTLAQYSEYHCGILGLTYLQKRKIVGLAEIFQKNVHTNGKDPVGYSAALIRYVTGLKRRYLSKRLFVSEPVITWRFNEIKGFFK